MTLARLFFCSFLFLGVAVFPAVSWAEDAPTEETPQKPGMLEDKEAAEKTEELRESANSLTARIMEGLDEAQQLHFYTIYSHYNLISTVRVVQKDVGNAIAACGKANPDMKEGLDARFKDWNAAVNPVMEEAKIKIDNMVAAQDYAKPKDMRKLLKNLDDMRTQIDSQIDKIPVSSPEACEYLAEKMDETQDDMVDMLRGTLTSQAMPPSKAEQPAADLEKPEEL